MRTWHATTMALLVLMATLAGCSEGEPIEVSAPDQPGGAYTFTANVEADNYTWDMGDRLTTKYGKEITHTYDFTNGAPTVRLRAKSGEASNDYTTQVTLGTGKNERGAFLLEASRVWTVPGETVKFSAAGSTDPDGDPIRAAWSCLRDGPAIRTPPHSHGPAGLIDYSAAKPGSVTSGVATRELPAATRTITGDLCEGLNARSQLSKDAITVEGSFTQTGVYRIFLLAADPAHPTVSGEFKVYVTAADERPEPVAKLSFSGTLQGGADGGLQSGCDTVPAPLNPGVCDRVQMAFDLPLNSFPGFLNVTYDAGATTLNQVRVEVRQLAAVIASNAKDGAPAAGSFTFPATSIPPEKMQSDFVLIVTLVQGAQADWSVTIDAPLDMDPSKVY